ncbi:MAG: Ig-like domain-containing protein [Tyzzerella sp.]|nr:Ig-like domain-containing protein [Tyzzerella sp.]
MKNNEKKNKKKVLLPIIILVAIITILLLGIIVKLLSGGDDVPTVAETNTAIEVETRSFLLKAGESQKISLKESDVTFESSNTAVATVTEDGTVTAVGSGMALITITKGDNTGYCGVIVDGIGSIVDITSKKAKSIISEMMLNSQREIEGMAVDTANNAMFFSQIYGTEIYDSLYSDYIVSKVELQKDKWTRGGFMRFYESGEGHLDVEDGKIWMESNGEYGVGTTISCVEWEDNGFVQGSFGQTYNIGEVSGTKLAVDSENNMIAVYDVANKQYLIYSRDTLAEGTENAYIHAVACALDQKPALGVDDSQNYYNASIQGFALADGYIYQIVGSSNAMYVSVFDLSGQLQYCSEIEFKTDLEDCTPAAIAVEDGEVYVCLQSGTSTCYYANVWKY